MPAKRPPQDFRELVQRRLRAKAWTVYRLCKETGISDRTVGRWLRGDRRISHDKLETIFHALNLRVAS